MGVTVYIGAGFDEEDGGLGELFTEARGEDTACDAAAYDDEVGHGEGLQKAGFGVRDTVVCGGVATC